MADNVAITAGSGTTVATDDRPIGHVQRVTDTGSTAIAASSDTSVTTSAESIAARDTRKSIVIYAASANTQNVLIGATGAENFPMGPGSALTLNTTAAVFYKSVSGTQTIYWIEEYD